MNTIDHRLVEMQFDNRQFESNVQTSIKSLDSLKQGLDLEGSVKGLAGLEKASRGFSLGGIADGVSAISSKFSALGIIGVTALQNITNSAINAGKKMVSALTIDPVKTGFAEYETLINATQVIKSNTAKKGTTLEEINEALAELNEYADQTIYNFTQMTSNIGKFTAAGIGLKESVSSIKGIANLSAVSGANADDASRAMYQLSQAMASGVVRAQDWRSVENANIGGDMFKNALMETARVHGVAIDKIMKKEGSFRESLKTGWLSADIMTETLGQFAGDFTEAELLAKGYTTKQAAEILEMGRMAKASATEVKTFTQLIDTMKEAVQSGWTRSWQLIIGDFDEAKVLLTGIKDYFDKVLGASADARNKVLLDWKEAGGREDLEGTFWNITAIIENIATVAKAAFAEIFPAFTGDKLKGITAGLLAFTERIKAVTENSEIMGKVSRIFKGIASAIDLVKSGISFLWRGVKRFFGMLAPASGSFLDFLAGIGDFLTGLKASIKGSETFQNVMAHLGNIMGSVRDFIVGIARAIGGVFSKIGQKIQSSGLFAKIGAGISAFLGGIPKAIDKLKGWGKAVIDFVKNSEALKKAWAWVKNFAGPIIAAIRDFAARIGEAIKGFFSADTGEKVGFVDKIKARFAAITEAFSGWFGDGKAKIGKVWGNIKAFFTKFFSQTLPNFFSGLSGKLGGFFGGVKGLDLGSILKVVLGVYSGIKALSFLTSFGKTSKALSNMGKGLKQIGGGIKNLVKNGLEVTHIKKDSIGTTLLKIAAAIGILVASIYVLSKMNARDIVKGLGVLSILLIELVVAAKMLGGVGGDGGKSLLLVAAAVALLVIPIKVLGSMDTSTIIKGVAALGAVLLELGIFSRIAGKGLGEKAGFVMLAISVNLLVIAVKSLGTLDIGAAKQGLFGLGVILGELAAYMRLTKGVKKPAGLLVMAIAINLLVRAARKLGQLKGETLAKGVGAITAMLHSFTALTKSSVGTSFLKSLITLGTIAGALWLFTEAFKQVDGLDAKNMVGFAIAVSAMLVALSITIAILSRIPITGALKAVGSIAIVIGGLGAIVAGLGWLQNEWSGMSGYLEAGGNVLWQIGNAVGKFFGGIGNGLITGLDLPGIGTDLSNFMKNVKPFLDGAKDIDETVTNGVLGLCGALIAISAAAIVDGLAYLITLFHNPVTTFCTNIVTLGHGLADYAAAIKPLGTLPEGVLMNSVAVAQGLADVANTIPTTGSVFKFLTGEQDLVSFSAGLGTLGTALVGFIKEISVIDSENYDESKVEAVTDVVTGLAALEASLQAQGGWQEKFNGVRSLKMFAEGMEPFAGKLNDFIMDIKQIDYDKDKDGPKMDAMLYISEKLAKMEANLEAQGGVEDAFNGVKSLKVFGAGLPAFAKGLNDFIAEARTIIYDEVTDGPKIRNVLEVAKELIEIEKSLEAQGGFADDLMGIKSLAAFGTEIPDFAVGMNKFLAIVASLEDKDYNQTKIDNVLKTAESIRSLQATLPATDGWWQSVIGNQDLTLFSTNIVLLGSALASFSRNIADVKTDEVDTALGVVTLFTDFVDTLKPSGGIGLEQLLEDLVTGSSLKTLQDYATTMGSVGRNMSAFTSGIAGSNVGTVEDAKAIFEVVEEFIGGIKKTGGAVNDIGEWATGSPYNTLTKYSETMGKVGTNLSTFSKGMSSVSATQYKLETLEKMFTTFHDVNAMVAGYDDVTLPTNLYLLFNLMGELGESLTQFQIRLKESDIPKLHMAANTIATLVTLVGTASSIDPANIAIVSEILTEYGKISFVGFSEGFTDGIDAFLLAVDGMIDDISGKEEGFRNSGTYLGVQFGKGLGNGIASMARAVQNAAMSVASGALRSIRMTWAVNSPSREANELGMFFDYGLAGGMDAYSRVVSASAENVGRNAIDSAKAMLATFNTAALDGMDTTPVIRPVIDMSDVTNGVHSINGMFDANRTLNAGLFSGAQFNRNAGALSFDGGKIEGSMTNQDVVDAIANLSERFNNLSEAVTNMNLVLDSGTLVGQLGPRIDGQLGVLAGRRERGN